MTEFTFSGADYVEERDYPRLNTQLGRVFHAMKDGEWRTVMMLAKLLSEAYPFFRFPENSIQAQLRNLRKLGHIVDRRHLGNGLYEYRVELSQTKEKKGENDQGDVGSGNKGEHGV